MGEQLHCFTKTDVLSVCLSLCVNGVTALLATSFLEEFLENWGPEEEGLLFVLIIHCKNRQYNPPPRLVPCLFVLL